MDSIRTNIEHIHRRIEQSCARSGRNPERVRLIAVSKLKPAAVIDAAFAAGQKLFGENYVQEFRDKASQVGSPVEWHFIGSLQTNKVKYLRGKVALIHSLDRLSLAREIDHQWGATASVAQVLLQVNLGDETSKAGCAVAELESLARTVAQLSHIRIRGLMCLPPHNDDPEQVRPYFRQLRELARQIDRLRIPDVGMDELSMGMSADFEVAIEEGATLIRVGTAIFGERV